MNVLNVFFFFFFQNVTFLKRSIDIIIFKLNSNEFKSLAQEMINIKNIIKNELLIIQNKFPSE